MNKRINEKAQNGIDYTLLKQESSKLAIILPGMGYTVQAPLLYYSTGLMFNKRYDVLHINYQYDSSFSKLGTNEQFLKIHEDVNEVINLVLAGNPYKDFTIIAKSIGTLALAALVNQERFFKAQTVWLTPLITRDVVYQALQLAAQQSLVIFGDEDPVYDEERFNVLKEITNITAKVITGLNHGLEIENDIYHSIEVIKQVTKEIDHFTPK